MHDAEGYAAVEENAVGRWRRILASVIAYAAAFTVADLLRDEIGFVPALLVGAVALTVTLAVGWAVPRLPFRRPGRTAR